MDLNNFIDSLFSNNSKKESEISKDIPLTIIPLSNIDSEEIVEEKAFEAPNGVKVKIETKTTKNSNNEFANLRRARNNSKRINSVKPSRNQSKRTK